MSVFITQVRKLSTAAFLLIAVTAAGIAVAPFVHAADASTEPDRNLLPLVYVNEVHATVDAQNYVNGTFTVRNSEKDAVGDLRYELQVIDALPTNAKDELIFDDPAVYYSMTSKDAFVLAGGEVKTFPINDLLPNLPKGKYRLRVQLVTGNGRYAGWNDQDVELSGANGFIVIRANTVTVNSIDPVTNEMRTMWAPKEGPNVDPLQKVTLNPVINNPGTETMIGYVKVEVQRQLSKNQVVKSLPLLQTVTLKAGEEKKLSLPIITEQKPGAYAVFLTFTNADGKTVSGKAQYRYVVYGASTSVVAQKVQDLPTRNGETVAVNFVVAGSADRVTPIKGIVRMTVSDDLGEIGSAESPLDIPGSAPRIGTAELSLTRNVCGVPHITLSVVQSDGKILETNNVAMTSVHGTLCSALTGSISKSDSITIGFLMAVLAVMIGLFVLSRRKFFEFHPLLGTITKRVLTSAFVLIGVAAFMFNMTGMVNANGIQQIIIRTSDPFNDPHPALFINSPQHDSVLTSNVVNYNARYYFINCGNELTVANIRVYEHINGGKVAAEGTSSEWKLLKKNTQSFDKSCHNCDDRTPQNVTLTGTFTLPSLSTYGNTTLWTVGDSRTAAMPALIYDFTWLNFNIARPSLTISKEGPASGTVAAGTVGTFEVTVTNSATATAPATNVQITDTIPMPAGTVFVPFPDSDQRCSQNGSSVLCNLGTMNVGAVEKVKISFRPPATTACGPNIWFKNTASVNATGIASLSSNLVTTTLVCAPPANLNITKTASLQTITLGDQLTYTIAVDNTTQTAVNNVTVTDVLPTINGGTISILSVQPSQGSCSQSTSSVTCNLATIPGFGHATVVITVKVGSATASCSNPIVINNVASVSATGITGRSAAASVNVNCPLKGTLTIKKTANPPIALRGEQMQYIIDVDAQTAAVDNVQITDLLPTLSNGGFTNISFITSQGTCSISGLNLTCNIGTITPGNLVRVTITATPAFVSGQCQNTTVNNIARVTGNGVSQISTNPVSFTATCPLKGTLTLAKTTTTSIVTRGGQVSYRIVATAQTSAVDNVTITDQLPLLSNGNLTNISFTNDHGTCSVVGRTVTCPVGTVNPGQPAIVTITATVGSTTDACANGTTINNTATANDSEGNIVYSNVLPVTVNCAAQGNLSIVKHASTTSVTRGGTLTYTIDVAATTAPVQNVTVTDVLPSLANGTITNITAASIPQGSCTIAGRSITCPLGTVTPSTPVHITITLTLGSVSDYCSPTTYVNSASVDSPTTNPVSATAETVAVNCPATGNLTLVKSVSSTTINHGDTVTYTIDVTASTAPVTNVTVTDQLPGITGGNVTSITAVSTPQGSCTVSGRNITCPLGTVNPSTPVHITITATYGAATDVCTGGNTVNNTAYANSDSTGTVSSNVQPMTVNCPGLPALQITKTASTFAAIRGDTVTYYVKVKNVGSAPAQSVQMNDQLPGLTNGTVTNVTASATPQGSCTVNGTNVSCPLGTIAAGVEVTVTITAKLGATTDQCSGTTTYNNVATASGANVNSVTSTTTSASIQVACPQPQNGCIDITKFAYDVNNNVIGSVPQFTFKLDGGTTVTNNSQGKAQFTNVTPGSHTVSEVVPVGWTLQNTTPSNGVVQVGAGTSCAAVSFTNKQNQIIGDGEVNIFKTDNRTTVAPGETLTYQITLTNTSTVQAQTVTVTDPLGSLVTFISASDSGFMNGSTVTWNNIVVPVNGTKVITLQVLVNSNASNGVQIVNIAYTGTKNSTDTTVIQGNNNGTVTVSLLDSPDPVTACGIITYSVQLQNNNSTATTVNVDLTYQSSDLSYSSASDGGFQNGNGVRWTGITIGGNSPRTLTAFAKVSCSATNNETVNAFVTTGTATANASTLVKATDNGNGNVSISLRDSEDPVQPGDTFDYTISLRNDDNVQRCGDLTLDLDSNTSFTDATSNGNDDSSDRVIWRNVCLSANDSRSFRATVRVRSTTEDGDQLEAEARFLSERDSETTDVQDDNNTCSNSNCNNTTGVTVSKTADRFEANPGDEVTYTITVRNDDGKNLSNMLVSDTFPSDQMAITDPAGGSVSGGRIEWTISVARNQVRTLVYRARISAAARAGDIIHNSVIVHGSGVSQSASADVRILGHLPQTGADDYTNALEDTTRFLTPFSGASASGGLGGMVAFVLGTLGTVGAGWIGKRYFL